MHTIHAGNECYRRTHDPSSPLAVTSPPPDTQAIKPGMTIKITPAAIALVVLLTPLGCATSAPNDGGQRPVISSASAGDLGRGELLYQTACAGCHTERPHWRENRLVRDWPGLIEQVTQWHRSAGQTWRADEIEDVATYLNDRFYRLPCPVRVCASPNIGPQTYRSPVTP